MHHVRTFFLCGVMAFSHYAMFIQNVFIFKRKAYRLFIVSNTSKKSSRRKLIVLFVCHRTVSRAAVYQLKMKYDQDKFGAVF